MYTHPCLPKKCLTLIPPEAGEQIELLGVVVLLAEKLPFLMSPRQGLYLSWSIFPDSFSRIQKQKLPRI